MRREQRSCQFQCLEPNPARDRVLCVLRRQLQVRLVAYISCSARIVIKSYHSDSHTAKFKLPTNQPLAYLPSIRHDESSLLGYGEAVPYMNGRFVLCTLRRPQQMSHNHYELCWTPI